jgi:NADPH:quinone reductase-like Zn-dependent oxidoreductase
VSLVAARGLLPGRDCAGSPRGATVSIRAVGLVRRPVTTVQFVANRENLQALASLLEPGDAKVVIDNVYPLAETAKAVARMLGHHARGKVVVTA